MRMTHISDTIKLPLTVWNEYTEESLLREPDRA